MQIRRIVLYNSAGETRELRFRLGRVNIISGPSERGKSAVLAIIDYCLGASRLGVPAGIIQDTVAWYGLELDFRGERMFIARPGVTPANLASTTWHISFGERDEPPALTELRATAPRDELIAKISAKLGIGTTMLPRQDGSVARRQLTVRSALIYCFQKQNEIANPDLYFHRQGDTGIAQQIRDTLPYYLGAISEEIIARQEELKVTRRRLAEVQRELDRLSRFDNHRDDEAGYLLMEAQRSGLIPDGIENDAGPDETMALLRRAETAALNPIEQPRLDVIARLTRELTALQARRLDLQREIVALEAFGRDQDLVQNGVNEQRRRLMSLGLVPQEGDAQDTCPVCQNLLVSPPPTAQEMVGALKSLDQELAFVVQDRTELTEALVRHRTALDETEAAITSLRRQIARLREEDERTRSLLERHNEMARVGGMIHMFLRVARNSETGNNPVTLHAEAAALTQTIEALEEETDFASVKTRIGTFLGSIGHVITTWAREQRLGYADGLLTFDMRRPGLVSENDRGSIPFSRFGSGKNWVWYHLLGHMALHKWFSQKNRPTPRFIVLDQPSQVYFPSGHTSEGKTDLDEVRRIYEWLFTITASLDGDMQVIVTDHAHFPDDLRFREHLEHDWWATDGALIPAPWV